MHAPVPLKPAHLPALLDLCAAACPLDTFSLDLLKARIFEDPRFSDELALGIEGADGLRAAVVCVIRTPAGEPPVGWIKLLAVHPRDRRAGLAILLLEEIEKRCRALGVPTLDTVGFPHYFWPGIDVRYTPACCLLEKRGFSEYRYTVNMIVDLAGQPFAVGQAEAALGFQGWTILRATPSDMPALLDFLRPIWPGWCDEVPNAMRQSPPTLFLACREGRIRGFAAYDTAMFPGTFGPMGTAPEIRGLGVGVVLLKRCLQDMKERGYPRCEIAWVGPVGFYARHVNAVIHRVFRGYRKNLG